MLDNLNLGLLALCKPCKPLFVAKTLCACNPNHHPRDAEVHNSSMWHSASPQGMKKVRLSALNDGKWRTVENDVWLFRVFDGGPDVSAGKGRHCCAKIMENHKLQEELSTTIVIFVNTHNVFRTWTVTPSYCWRPKDIMDFDEHDYYSWSVFYNVRLNNSKLQSSKIVAICISLLRHYVSTFLFKGALVERDRDKF